MTAICGIYKITSPTKKVYIGQSRNIPLRFKYYQRMACDKQTFLYHSFKKHGVKKHKFEIIHVCTVSELNELETYYIQLFSCFNTRHGLNLRAGGAKSGHSDQTKEKLRVKAVGRVASEETKRKLREASKNRPPMSEETKLRHSLSAMGKNKGRKQSAETIAKRKETILRMGRKCSQKFIDYLRERMKGNKFNLGKRHSEETIEKMRIAAAKRIVHPGLSSYRRRGCRCEGCVKAYRESYQKSKEKQITLNSEL